MPWWGWVLIAAGIAGSVVIYLLVKILMDLFKPFDPFH